MLVQETEPLERIKRNVLAFVRLMLLAEMLPVMMVGMRDEMSLESQVIQKVVYNNNGLLQALLLTPRIHPLVD